MTGSLLLQFNSIGNWKLPVRGVRVARRPHPDLAAAAPLSLLAGCGAPCGSSSEGSWGVSPCSSSRGRSERRAARPGRGPKP